MNLYAESSAVLSWLFSEPRASEVTEALSAAEMVLVSALTLAESERALIRGTTLNLLSEAAAADRRALLSRSLEQWILFDVDSEVLSRASRPFPREPLRTLDAIHLATGTVARSLVPDLAFLSLDRRVRSTAQELGFEVLPVDAA